MTIRGKAHIAGAYEHPDRKIPGKSVAQVHAEVALGAVADAVILGHLTDGVVLCVEGARTPREHVARVRDMLLRANVRILGVLINNLSDEGAGYGALDTDDLYYGDPGAYAQESRPASAVRLR